VPAFGETRKNRALGFAAVAHGDDVFVEFAGLEQFEQITEFTIRQFDAFFAHDFHHQRIDFFGRRKTGAFDLKMFTGNFYEVGGGHLAAAAVVLTDKKNSGFHGHGYLPVERNGRAMPPDGSSAFANFVVDDADGTGSGPRRLLALCGSPAVRSLTDHPDPVATTVSMAAANVPG
jgi:hypothetical protein